MAATAQGSHIVVVEPYNTEDDLINAPGFFPLVARLEGLSFQSDWDWLEKQTDWQELADTMGNDGFVFLVLVRDAPGVLPALPALCRAAAKT